MCVQPKVWVPIVKVYPSCACSEINESPTAHLHLQQSCYALFECTSGCYNICISCLLSSLSFSCRKWTYAQVTIGRCYRWHREPADDGVRTLSDRWTRLWCGRRRRAADSPISIRSCTTLNYPRPSANFGGDFLCFTNFSITHLYLLIQNLITNNCFSNIIITLNILYPIFMHFFNYFTFHFDNFIHKLYIYLSAYTLYKDCAK